jgi:hypothetical protein
VGRPQKTWTIGAFRLSSGDRENNEIRAKRFDVILDDSSTFLCQVCLEELYKKGDYIFHEYDMLQQYESRPYSSYPIDYIINQVDSPRRRGEPYWPAIKRQAVEAERVAMVAERCAQKLNFRTSALLTDLTRERPPYAIYDDRGSTAPAVAPGVIRPA